MSELNSYPYRIVRVYSKSQENKPPREILKRNVSFKEAKQHCDRQDSSKKDVYVDIYEIDY